MTRAINTDDRALEVIRESARILPRADRRRLLAAADQLETTNGGKVREIIYRREGPEPSCSMCIPRFQAMKDAQHEAKCLRQAQGTQWAEPIAEALERLADALSVGRARVRTGDQRSELSALVSYLGRAVRYGEKLERAWLHPVIEPCTRTDCRSCRRNEHA